MKRNTKARIALTLPMIFAVLVIAGSGVVSNATSDGNNLNEQTGLYECPHCEWTGKADRLVMKHSPGMTEMWWTCPVCGWTLIRGEIAYEK